MLPSENNMVSYLTVLSMRGIRELIKDIYADDEYEGKPYFEGHLMPVAQLAVGIGKELGMSDSELLALSFVAYAHDVKEDHPERFTEILQVASKFPINDQLMIIDSLNELTKSKDEGYFEYINGISWSFALIVKKADLTFNLGQSLINHPTWKKIDTYKFALDFVSKRLDNLKNY
jgi:hypothetical protein